MRNAVQLRGATRRFLAHFPHHLFLAACLLLPFEAVAYNVQFAWDANPDASVIGYRLHYVSSADNQDQFLDVGNATTGTLTGLAAGSSYTVTVLTYNDEAVEGAPSNAVTIQDTGAPNQSPSVTLTAPNNGQTYAAPASIVLSANVSDPDGTIARVEFYSGGSLVGQATAAPYTFTMNNVPAGTYTLLAKAFDNAGASAFSTTASVTVSDPTPNQPPAVALTGPSNGQTYTAPATIVLAASASDPDGTVGRVEFYNGGSLLGQATAAPYSFTMNNVPAGSYTLLAKAFDNAGGSAASTSITVTVSDPAPNQPPTVSLTGPANGQTFTAPATIVLTASATDADGTVARVEFFSGGVLVGQAVSAPYTLTLNNVSQGTFTFVAKSFDNAGASTLSDPVTVTVTANLPPPSPPSSSSIVYSASGATFNIQAGAGMTETIYYSSDLVTWSVLATLNSGSGSASFTDAAAPSVMQRFYRITDSAGASEPFGFSKIRLPGGTKQKPTTQTYLGFGFTGSIADRGAVTAVGDHTLQDNGASWADNAYTNADGGYYLEVTSGPNAGLMTDLLGTNGATKTLTLADDLSSALTGGETYVIRQHRTIGNTFGVANDAGLKSGANSALADLIRIYDPVAQRIESYYYQTGALLGGTGWRLSSDARTDASSTTLYLEQGVIVARSIGRDITLVMTGAVRQGTTLVGIGAQSNLVSNCYPAGTMTLDSAGLYTGDPATGLAGAASLTAADEVQIWDGAAMRRYYYKNSGAGGTGWRIASNSKANYGSLVLKPNSSFYIVRKAGRPAFNWTVTQPY